MSITGDLISVLCFIIINLCRLRILIDSLDRSRDLILLSYVQPYSKPELNANDYRLIMKNIFKRIISQIKCMIPFYLHLISHFDQLTLEFRPKTHIPTFTTMKFKHTITVYSSIIRNYLPRILSNIHNWGKNRIFLYI